MSWAHRLAYRFVIQSVGEGGMSRCLEVLKSRQWDSLEHIQGRQASRLAGVLVHAAETVPAYRRSIAPLMELISDPSHLLGRLPPISKQEVQNNAAEFRSTHPAGRVSQKTTGGSTGQAVTILKNRDATAAERAAMWLGYGWFGVEIGDAAARFWGAPFATRNRWVVRLADLAMHRIRFSAFAFGERDLENYWERCRRFRPAYLHGYVSMLTEFAAFLEATERDGRDLPLKSVIATAEALSQPQRELLERVFGVPVQIEYGCGEVGPIAYECPEHSLHLMAENLYVEVLREDGTPAAIGEPGEIVVTDLTNRAMPLIRYRLGDFSVPGDACPCGRGLPTLRQVWGRAYDFVEGPDGRRYHGEFFMYLFEDLRREGLGVHQFKVEQVGPAELRILVLHPGGLAPKQSDRLLQLLHHRLHGVTANVIEVEELPRAPSGKMRVIENRWRQSGAAS